MFTKILTAVDGSDISERAVEKAVDLAKQNGAELHLIYVIETGFISPGPGDSVRDLVHKRFEDEGKEILHCTSVPFRMTKMRIRSKKKPSVKTAFLYAVACDERTAGRTGRQNKSGISSSFLQKAVV